MAKNPDWGPELQDRLIDVVLGMKVYNVPEHTNEMSLRECAGSHLEEYLQWWGFLGRSSSACHLEYRNSRTALVEEPGIRASEMSRVVWEQSL